MALFLGLVRGYRRLAARVLPRGSCPICLDDLPVLGLGETRTQRLRGGDCADEEEEEEPTFAKLSCKHKFCAGGWAGCKLLARCMRCIRSTLLIGRVAACIRQYMVLKIQAKEVDDGACKSATVACGARSRQFDEELTG